MFFYKLEMLIIKSLIELLKLLPINARYKFIENIAKLFYKYGKSRREVAHKNIKIAFPDISEEEVARVALASYKNVLKGFVMAFWLERFQKPENARFVNEEILDNALAKNKGLIIISMHMGSLDAGVRATEKVEIRSVARKQRNPLMNEYMKNLREKVGYKTIYRGEQSVRTFIKALRNKGAVFLVSDHYDTKGTEIEFFGRKTKVSSGAINLALRYTDVPMIFLFNEINSDNTISIHFEEGIELEKTGDKEKDLELNLKKVVNKFEEIITNYPEQWMWFHKRWRK